MMKFKAFDIFAYGKHVGTFGYTIVNDVLPLNLINEHLPDRSEKLPAELRGIKKFKGRAHVSLISGDTIVSEHKFTRPFKDTDIVNITDECTRISVTDSKVAIFSIYCDSFLIKNLYIDVDELNPIIVSVNIGKLGSYIDYSSCKNHSTPIATTKITKKLDNVEIIVDQHCCICNNNMIFVLLKCYDYRNLHYDMSLWSDDTIVTIFKKKYADIMDTVTANTYYKSIDTTCGLENYVNTGIIGYRHDRYRKAVVDWLLWHVNPKELEQHRQKCLYNDYAFTFWTNDDLYDTYDNNFGVQSCDNRLFLEPVLKGKCKTVAELENLKPVRAQYNFDDWKSRDIIGVWLELTCNKKSDLYNQWIDHMSKETCADSMKIFNFITYGKDKDGSSRNAVATWLSCHYRPCTLDIYFDNNVKVKHKKVSTKNSKSISSFIYSLFSINSDKEPLLKKES